MGLIEAEFYGFYKNEEISNDNENISDSNIENDN